MFALLVALGSVFITSIVGLYIWKHIGEKNVTKKLEPEVDEDEDRVMFIFGSQTGTAEGFAKDLRTEVEQRYGGETKYKVIDIEDYDHENRLERENLIFFLLATNGDGEPTDTASNFFSWITDAANEAKEDKTKQILKDVNFGIFALGNRQYEQFCAIGKKVQAAMLDLGANSIVEKGEGDDEKDIKADFSAWKGQLFNVLDESHLVRKPGHDTG